MNPTKYQTDTLNLGLNWVGEKAHWSASYDGSFFHDDFTSMSFSNPYVATGTTGTALAAPAFPVNNMSTAPSNEFHQLSLTGGYNLAAATKLSGGLSFGRNTQNENYAGTYTTTPNTVTTLPVASLNGLVNTTHADLKLTHQATKALALMAAVKYNERDNHTASNTYVFIHLAGASATVVNIPMSNRRTQFELAGDYRLSPRQRLHLGYEYDMIKRWCNNPLANNAQGAGPSSYYTTASCAQVPESDESRVNLTYKLKASETIDLNAGYTYSNRKSEVNSSFYNPLQSRTSGYENYGYLAFFQASRKQDLYKAGVTWEATDRLNLGLNGRYTRDDYDSLLGVQSGQSGSVNLDGTYSFSETSTISAYGTWQTRRRDLLTANGRSTTALLPNLWTNNLTEEDRTVGISGRQKGFLGGKLDLGEDLTFSAAKSRYATDLYYINTTVGNKGITPDIKSELTQLRFTGSYHVDKASTVVLGYTFQRLSSVDYMYNGFQYGYTPTTLLSTNQQAPNYIIHAIFGTYSYTFQ
jgi:MtrB/PioB family decaheme-associated outer membrane protein